MRYIDSLPATFRKYILDTEYHRYGPPAMCGTMRLRVMQRKSAEGRRRMRSWRRALENQYYQNWMAVTNLKSSPFLPSSQLNVFYESCKTELTVNSNGEDINLVLRPISFDRQFGNLFFL